MEKSLISFKKRRVLYLAFLYFTFLIFIYLIEVSHISPYSDIIKSYRINRISCALMAGLVIGGSGAILQSSLRNPLVDHYILGIGSGALFFYYLSLLFLPHKPIEASVWGVAGGMTALALTAFIAQRLSGSDVSYVLSGLAVNSLFSGLSLTLSYVVVKKNPYAPYHFLGSFVLSTGDKLPPLMISLISVSIAYVLLAKPLNALLISDEHALQLNYNPKIIRLASAIWAGAASSIVVSLFGLLGFVGLVSPHISRLIFQTGDNRIIIPASMVISSLIVYLTDVLSKRFLVTVTGEIPAGAIASLLGAPFFLLLLVTKLRR